MSCSMFMGRNAYRKNTLISHWKSQAHTKFEERKGEETQSSNLVGQIVECVRKMDSNLEE